MASPHIIRISLDSDSNMCDEVSLVGTVACLLEVPQGSILVLKVERSLLIPRKLSLVLAMKESDNTTQWESKLILGQTLGTIGKITHVDVNLSDGQSPPRRRTRSTTSPIALAEWRVTAQGRIIQELRGENFVRAIVLGTMNPGVGVWGCVFRWRLSCLSTDPATLDRLTVKTLASEGEFILAAMNNHIFDKQQELLLSPKSQKKVLKQEMKELDARCSRLREAFDSVTNTKRQAARESAKIAGLAAQLSELLHRWPPEEVVKVLQQIRDDTNAAEFTNLCQHCANTSLLDTTSAAATYMSPEEEEEAAEAAAAAAAMAKEAEEAAAAEATAAKEAEEAAQAEAAAETAHAAARAAWEAGDFDEADRLQKIADEASATAAREREESEAAAATAAREKAEADDAAAYNKLYSKYPRALLCGRKYEWSTMKCIQFGAMIEANLAEKGITDVAERADTALQMVIVAIKEDAKLKVFMERKRKWGVRTMLKRMMCNLKLGFLDSALVGWQTNMSADSKHN